MDNEKPIPDYHELTRRAWDARAETEWGESGETDPFFEQFYERHRRELDRDVLDIGAGKGRYAIRMAKDGFDVTALEPSAKMAEAARAKASEAGLNVSIVRGQSSELPFRDNSFDFILSVGAIHFNNMADVEKSFREVNRVLRKEKYFLLQVRSAGDETTEREIFEDFRNKGHGFTAIDKGVTKAGVIQHYFTEKELTDLADNNGFEITVASQEREAKEWSGKMRKRLCTVMKKKEKNYV